METTPLIVLIVVGLVVVMVIVVAVLKKLKGSIEILPEKYSYGEGETINGKINLKLKRSVAVKKLIIGLKCENSSHRRNSSSSKDLFDFNQPVFVNKNLSPGESSYNFSVVIPKNVSPNLEGAAGQIIKTAQILSGSFNSVRWYLYSELQCDGVNLTQRIRINLV